MTVRGGNLNFTLTYRHSVIEEGTVDAFWSGYERALRAVAAGQALNEATLADLVKP